MSKTGIEQMERAYSLFAEMKALGVEPNTHCYNPLIMGFATQVLHLHRLHVSITHK